MIATWRRLGFMTEEDFASRLRDMYVNRALSHAMIACEIGADPETVRLLCARYGIAARRRSEALALRWDRARKDVALDAEQEAVMDGLMLGDGHIDRLSDFSARYTHGSKYIETLWQIERELPSLRFGPVSEHRRNFFFKSRSTPLLCPWRERWYPLGRKLVPDDLDVSRASTLYWWFVGDGSISRRRYDLKLSTDGFSDHCREILVDRLSRLGVRATTPSAGFLLVSASSVPRFYSLVGDCRSPEYNYKWDYIPPRWTFNRKEARGCAER